jgi:hypothetical protein
MVFVINNSFLINPLNYDIFMPGVEIKGQNRDIHSVNTNLNAWSGNKGAK